MTGPTHRQYSICFGFLAMMLIYSLGMTKINYYLALLIVLDASKHGALFPDLDHHWNNININNKTVPSRIINLTIRCTGGTHRSWQTHSIDIATWFTAGAFIIPYLLYKYELFSLLNKEVLSILWLGFASGWISHLFSDMLTSEGVRLFCFSKKKIKLVSRKIGKLRFNTGNEWEKFVYNVMKKINILLGVLSVMYPILGQVV